MDEPKLKKFLKCEYISPSLECFLGGDGTFNCLDQCFHEGCALKVARSKKPLNSSGSI